MILNGKGNAAELLQSSLVFLVWCSSIIFHIWSDFDTISEVKGAYHKFTRIQRDLPRYIDVWTNLSEILWDTGMPSCWIQITQVEAPTSDHINLDGALPLEAKICPQVSLCFWGCVTTTGGTWSDGATIKVWRSKPSQRGHSQGKFCILTSFSIIWPDLWLTGWCLVRKECSTILAFQRGQKKQVSLL